jgi:hypothetical protein
MTKVGFFEDGDNRTLRVKADIASGVEPKTLTVKFDEVTSDVIATGLDLRFWCWSFCY